MRIETVSFNDLGPTEISRWREIQRFNGELINPSFCPEFTAAIASVRTDVEIAVLEEDNRLVGFFPFQRKTKNTAYPVGSLISDMNGVIIEDGVQWNAEELLRACALECWHFDHLIAEQRPFGAYHQAQDVSGFMDLSQGYQTYLESRHLAGTSIIRDGLRKARKAERELGPLRLEWNNPDRAMLGTFLEWKQKHIARQGFYDVYREDWVVSAIGRVLECQGADFAGFVSTLHAGDELLAIVLGMQGNNVASSWLPTYNPAYQRFSPGLIQHLEIAKQAAELGIIRIDLGRGENRMKSGLMSDFQAVAIGSVELRALHRFRNSAWFGLRAVAHSDLMKGWPLQSARRAKNFLVSLKS